MRFGCHDHVPPYRDLDGDSVLGLLSCKSGVSFQQVVHPIRIEGAGAVKLQSSREDRMNSHQGET